jgi:hypothetical protein
MKVGLDGYCTKFFYKLSIFFFFFFKISRHVVVNGRQSMFPVLYIEVSQVCRIVDIWNRDCERKINFLSMDWVKGG